MKTEEMAKDKEELIKKDKREMIQIVRGSGNVFRDLGHEDADVQQLKAILAAEILKMLDREGLTVRAAHSRTGIAAADFSRIRNADLGRFTIDRLVCIINRLGSRVEASINLRPAAMYSSIKAVAGLADRSIS